MNPYLRPPLLTQIYRGTLLVVIVASGILCGVGYRAFLGAGDIVTPCAVGVLLWIMAMAGGREIIGFRLVLGVVWAITFGIVTIL